MTNDELKLSFDYKIIWLGSPDSFELRGWKTQSG